MPLQGPGFILTLDDAPGLRGRRGRRGRRRGRSRAGCIAKDLQYVTNALWEAGAEAVSINGKRLTSTSAIRFAGSAIIVDYRPLTRPYVITALGDPQRFPAAFADGAGGTYLSTLRSTFGVRVDTEVSDDLTVPGGGGPDHPLRHAPGILVRHRVAQPHPVAHPHAREEPVVIPAIGLALGIIIGLLLQPAVPVWLQPYLPIAVIAALDAVFGAVRAILDGIFDDKVFVVSFLSNVVVAAFIVFLGDKLGVGSQLSTGVVVVLGVRIFSNVAAIRRHLFDA